MLPVVPFFVFEEVEALIEEVVLVGVFLIVGTHLKRLLENGYNIGAVRGANKVKRTADFFNEFVPARRHLLVHINFVGDHDAGNMGAVTAHLLVPVFQIGVRNLPLSIEHQNAHMRAEIISRMKLVERFLSGGIPDIYLQLLTFHCVLVAIHRQGMRGGRPLLVVIQ